MEVAAASPRQQRRGKDKTVAEIERLAKQRANRRKSAEEFKRKREHEIRLNEKKGQPGDVDFQRMIRRFRKYEMAAPSEHRDTGPLKINVVVRKRPVSESEVRRKDFDSVSCSHPLVYVHNCKLKVDGISKVLSTTSFHMDHSFHESASNELVYTHTAKYLVEFAIGGGRATCFAYGQTGSGKTYTMAGVQALAARDVFTLVSKPEARDMQLEVYCAFFELYGGRCMDLLHDRRVCSIREDGKGRVQVEGLQEIIVEDEDELLQLIDRGNTMRTTHATEMNSDSSRSHAICQIALRKRTAREGSEPFGKLSLIDLAGSERGQDTKHHNRQRRQESAEINKSLLALKECVRALDSGSSHVPYRASKLTMVLKDSFSNDARTVMISCISPVASSADHTLNTLRYADRVKEKKAIQAAPSEVISSTDANNRTPGNDTSFESDSDDLSFGSHDVIDEEDEEDLAEEEEADLAQASSNQVSALPEKAPKPPAAAESRRVSLGAKRGTPAKGPPVRTPVRSAQRPQRKGAATPSRAPAQPDGGSRTPTASRVPVARSASKLQPPSAQKAQSRARRNWEDPAKAEPPKPSGKREPLQASSGNNNNNNNLETGEADAGVGSGGSGRSLEAKAAGVGKAAQAAEESESLDFQDVVSKLVDMEEDLLSAHMKAIQRNADMLTEEGVLLSKVQGSDVVDYDIDEYASRLDDILAGKIALFQGLQSKLSVFRKHLALEEVASNIVES